MLSLLTKPFERMEVVFHPKKKKKKLTIQNYPPKINRKKKLTFQINQMIIWEVEKKFVLCTNVFPCIFVKKNLLT